MKLLHLALSAAIGASVLMSPFLGLHTVSAATYTPSPGACSTNRTYAGGPNWDSWDGWTYPNIYAGNHSYVIGGVWATINTYDNRYDPNNPNWNNYLQPFDYTWVMLTLDQPSGPKWVQFGYETGALAASHGYNSEPEIQWNNGSGPQNEYGSELQVLDSQSQLENLQTVFSDTPSNTYTVLYDNAGPNEFSFQFDGMNVYLNNKLYVVPSNWEPTDAQDSAEVKTDNVDQMYGDTSTPQSFSRSEFYYNGSAYPFDADPFNTGSPASDNVVTLYTPDSNSSSPSYFRDVNYGAQYVGSEQLDIWDYACPFTQDVYATTGNAGSDVYYNYWNGLSWDGWSNLNYPPGTTVGANASIGADSLHGGTEDINLTVNNGSAYQIYYNYWNGSSWDGGLL